MEPRSVSPTPAALDAERDAALVARLAASDRSALDELLQRHYGPVVAYVENLLGDPDGAEDVAQETFLYVWDRRSEWCEAGSLRGLLYTVARNKGLNRLRSLRVRMRSADRVRRQSHERSAGYTPLQTLEQAELREAIEAAIEALPARRREVFVLAYVHGLSHAEIAAALGITVRTVKNQVSSSLAELRQVLQPLLREARVG